jgi:hypothetical protein
VPEIVQLEPWDELIICTAGLEISPIIHNVLLKGVCRMSAQTKTMTASVSTPVTELEFGPTGISDGVHGELTAAPAYGDFPHGPHSTLIKMPAGFVSPTHEHTEDCWVVVVSGVMVNKKPDGPDVPLPVGSYYFQKGGEPHVTKCISPNDCLFFISQDGKFDYHE